MNRLKIGLLLSLPFLYAPLKAVKEAHHAKHINLSEHNETVKKAIVFLDGQVGRVDGNTFGTIFLVRNKLNAFRLGAKKDGHRTGSYLFRDQHYSIDDLAEKIEAHYVGDAELNTVLALAKKDFEELVGQFINQAKGTKSFLVTLIEESCYRRNRKNSILLTWASSTEEHETVIFHTEVQSFRGLAEFCQDLENFLEDLMFSCPKAMDQFKKKREQYSHDRN